MKICNIHYLWGNISTNRNYMDIVACPSVLPNVQKKFLKKSCLVMEYIRFIFEAKSNRLRRIRTWNHSTWIQEHYQRAKFTIKYWFLILPIIYHNFFKIQSLRFNIQTRNFFYFTHSSLPLDFQVVVQKQKILRILSSFI